MVKAKGNNGKTYYIFQKKGTELKGCILAVAHKLHERADKFECWDAKLIGKTENGCEQFEIGTKGGYYAVVRKEK